MKQKILQFQKKIKRKKKNKKKKEFQYEKTVKREKFSKIDWLYLAIIVILFAAFGFYQLGSTKMANTYWKPDVVGDSVILDVGDQDIDALYYLVGVGDDPFGNTVNLTDVKYEVEMSTDKINWKPVTLISNISMYAWTKIPVSIIGNQYVRIRCYDTAIVMNEIGFGLAGEEKLADVSYVESTSYTRTGRELIDEQDMIDMDSTYYTGTYFDEIYHARTAYEQLKGYPIYETTHPVLGKEIISIGIAIFGMNPFGWRFMGVFCAVLMLPILYNFIKQMFHKPMISFVGTFLFAFDFMHYTQSRLATIDTYAVIFTMLIYYFMYRYYQTSFYDTDLKKTFRPLFLCGIFVGIGFASKWNVAYGFIGIAILFFMNMYKRYKEYLHAKKKVEVEHSTDEMDQKVYQSFRGNFVKTIFACVLFFVIIPCIIYYLSFIFIFDITDIGAYTKQVIDYNVNMFNYHSKLVAAHPFESSWYEWPIMTRPIWYAWNESTFHPGVVSSISAFGNPLVWWGGLGALLATLIIGIKKRDKIAAFIIIGYLSVLLPWACISRIVFIYHYYPAVIFLALALAYVAYHVVQKWKKGIYAVMIYVAIAYALFFYFFPILSGSPTTKAYLKQLQWLPSWSFTLE